MKGGRYRRQAAILALALATAWGCAGGAADAPFPAKVVAAFDADCETLLVQEVAAARQEILVAAYLITRPRIVNALAAAARRGVRVRVKYDARQAEYAAMKDAIAELRRARVRCAAVRLRADYASMHHKFLVVDKARVLTGSYNFTGPASEDNCENLVRIESPELAGEFAVVFDAIPVR